MRITDLTVQSAWVMETESGNGFLIKDENAHYVVLEDCENYGCRFVARKDFRGRYAPVVLKSVAS